jgi:hypothetical protein
MALQNPVAVYNAAANAEAQVVRSLLVDAGIEAFAVDDVSVVGTWALGLIPEIHKPQVWVDRRHVEQARALIEAYEQRSAEQEHGDTVDFCYECGEPVDSGVSTCPACGQSLDLEVPENSDHRGRRHESEESAEANPAIAHVRLDFFRSFKKPLAWLFVGPLLLGLGLSAIAIVMELFR